MTSMEVVRVTPQGCKSVLFSPHSGQHNVIFIHSAKIYWTLAMGQALSWVIRKHQGIKENEIPALVGFIF